MKREERINRDAALKDSKECPHCGSLTSKSGGCNHITCPVVRVCGGRPRPVGAYRAP